MDMNSIINSTARKSRRKKRREKGRKEQLGLHASILKTQHFLFYFCQLPVLTFEYNTTRVNK